MLRLSADGVYRSDTLTALPWLTHGFGTRLSTGWPGAYTSVKQIHSDRVLTADDGASGVLGQADGLITNTPGQLIGVRTADCVPVLLVDPQRRVVAAVHAGWRGTVLQIVPNAIVQMQQHYGTRPDALLAVIGPAIGACCYEVGEEVGNQFRKYFPEQQELRCVDLAEANRRQMIHLGVQNEAIETAGLCTKCGMEFHSYRRDREESGRMVAAIGVLPQT